MPFNYAAQRLRADRMISRYGGPAKLRKAGDPDVDCTVAEVSYTPQERHRQQNPVDREVLLSAHNLLVSPTQRHSLVMLHRDTLAELETLRISAPPERLAPAGGLTVFWSLRVRG
jgi:hypothetical protein